MTTNLTSDINSYCQQWTSFAISILTSDFSLFQDVSDFGKNEMPQLQALPGKMKDFVSAVSAQLNEVKNNHSTSELKGVVDQIQSFCNINKSFAKDVVAKLDDLRAKVAGNVGDMSEELEKVQAEYDVLNKQWQDAINGCQDCEFGVRICAMAQFGEDNYANFIADAFLINKLTFAKNCISGLVSDIMPLTSAFDQLEDTTNNMLEDIQDGFADIPDIEDFLSQLK